MRTTRRAGFTLVEMMVAMALTLFVMVILSQAFVLSLETFSGMKGIGDMQQNLRVATTLLRDDLSQDHFEGKRRLSDPNIANPTQLPQAGFFAIHQRSGPPVAANTSYVNEGNDTNGMASFRAIDHVLYMAVKRKGNRREDYFTTPLQGPANMLAFFFNQRTAYNVSNANISEATLTLPYAGGNSGFYSSQWAEVVYYLKRQGSTEEVNNANSQFGTPTFELYRAEFVMVPDATDLRKPSAANFFNRTPTPVAAATLNNWSQSTFKGMSHTISATQLNFLTPADAALGNRMIPNLTTFNPQTATPTAVTNRVLLSETAVLPNVISFQVVGLPDSSTDWRAGLTYNVGNIVVYQGCIYVCTQTHVSSILTNPETLAPRWSVISLYDTTQFSNAAYAGRFPLKAVQITLRVFDSGTRQTRQVTVVQDL